MILFSRISIPVKKDEVYESLGGQKSKRNIDSIHATPPVFPGIDPEMMNIHSKDGLIYLAKLMMQTKVGGLLWLSPTCSSWVWLSRGSSLRGIETKQNYKIDEWYGPVLSLL